MWWVCWGAVVLCWVWQAGYWEHTPLLNMCTSLLVRLDKVSVQTLVDPSLYFNHTVQCTEKHRKFPGLPGCILHCLCFLVQWKQATLACWSRVLISSIICAIETDYICSCTAMAVEYVIWENPEFKVVAACVQCSIIFQICMSTPCIYVDTGTVAQW